MAISAEQMKEFEATESAEISENGDVIRSHMNQILRDPYFQKTLDKESLKGYQDIADKKGHINPDDTENLKRFYKFMQEQWKEIHQMKKRITSHIEKAIQEKIITEEDRVFYKEKMKENVINGNQIVTKEILEKAEKEILESLTKRKNERREYDQIANHRLLEESKFLKISKKESIEVPNEKGFLKLSVPERRILLKKLKTALSKAERYADEEGDIEAEKMIADYKKALMEASEEGFIGKRTMEKYIEGFKKIDNREKKYWLGEMRNGNQLKRYSELWKNICKTLEGAPLKRMDQMRDKMGYSELLHEFGHIKEAESNSITNDYSQRLKVMHQQGVISLHTMKAFINDIKSQTLEGKKEYMKGLDQQMQKYKILRVKINQLKDKGARQFLDEMYTSMEYGFSEIEAKYKRFTSQKIGLGDALSVNGDAEVILNNMESDVVRKEFRRSIQELDYGQHKKFKEKLSDFFSKRSEKSTGNYQDSIRSARAERVSDQEMGVSKEDLMAQSISEKTEIKDQRENEVEAELNSSDSPEIMETVGLVDQKTNGLRVSIGEVKTKTSNDGGFRKMSYVDDKGKVKRVIRATGSKESVQAFNQEDSLDPNNVDIHLFGTDGSITKEAELIDIKKGIRALEKTLEDKRMHG